MSILFTIFTVLDVVVCCFLVGVILMQKKNSTGLAGTIGGMGAGQTYWDKNKGRSLEGQLEKYTKIAAFLFLVLTFVINFIK